MNKILKTLAVVIFGTIVTVLVANAALLGPQGNALLSPQQWSTNSSANTIAPNPSTLQVPCANIVGGCGLSSSTAVTSVNSLVGAVTISGAGLTGVTQVGNVVVVSSSIPINTVLMNNSASSTVGNIPFITTTGSSTISSTSTINLTNNILNVPAINSTGTATFQATTTFVGHMTFPTSSVAVSSCGGGATVLGSDQGGMITVGSSTAGCTLIFAQPWNFIPVCTATGAKNAVVIIIRSETITTTTVNFADSANFPTSSIVDYMCQGNPN